MRAWGGIAFLLLLLSAAPAAAGESCEQRFDSTFAMVEQLVFERRGCTSVTCHSGAAPAGGLDLTPGVAYDQLVDVPPQSVAREQHPGLARVVPSNKARSLLWLNLAGATLPGLWQAPLRPMPIGGLAPLTTAELELVQLWIENGATRDGVVPGSGELFDACLPPPEPLQIAPLPPPPPGTGVQMRAPSQVLPANTERETCFVSYYDVTDQVPPEYRGPDGTTFRYKRLEARQDPLSHHAVVIVYRGSTPIESPLWGPFACRGGARDGQACAPRQAGACGDDGICASPPRQSPACIGFGPGDASIGIAEDSLFNSMGTALDGSDGVYEEAPLAGILVWNSHAFNVTHSPGALDMWVNFEFAAPAEQQRLLDRFVNIAAIGGMQVPAFGAQEICHHHVVPAGHRLIEIASHTHKRGKRFRVFEGDFTCRGGARAGQACSPYGPDPGFPVADLCAGAPCEAVQPPRMGDCDGDLRVSVDELVLGVSLAARGVAPAGCPRFDGDGSGTITIDELLAAVGAAIAPALRDGDASLVYTSLTYADPLILGLRRDYPVTSVAAERTLTYCGLYDNGYTDPAQVRRNSTRPTNAGPCAPTHCAEGRVGDPCTRHADCDSAPAAGDGACDACTVGFGLSTDDEMFVLIGSTVPR